jgi:hypothetical protein
MNKTKLASHVCVLALSLLIFGGCGSGEGGTTATGPAADVAGPAATETPPEGSGTIGNASPEIWGTPETSATAGAAYYFQPEASDSDGDALEFSIANKPGWTVFDTVSGSLQGTPDSDDVGQDANIVISVTDQNSVSSLASLTIEVNQVYTPPAEDGDEDPVSAPPVISGTPNSAAVVNSLYSFLPEASDAESDELSFSIVNKPQWARFDVTTGLLEGTPTDIDLGESDAIEISVADGNSIAALARFTIAVEQTGASSFTLSWMAPTQNEDGSALTDLAGYRIYYGTTTANYSEEVSLTSPGATSYVIENLVTGKYFLVMTSVNSDGLESKYTPELALDLGG